MTLIKGRFILLAYLLFVTKHKVCKTLVPDNNNVVFYGSFGVSMAVLATKCQGKRCMYNVREQNPIRKHTSFYLNM